MNFSHFLESIFRLADHYKHPESNLKSSVFCFIEDIIYKKAKFSTCHMLKLLMYREDVWIFKDIYKSQILELYLKHCNDLQFVDKKSRGLLSFKAILKLCIKSDIVDTSMKFKWRNREYDVSAPVWEEHQYIRAPEPEDLRVPNGRRGLIFNNIVEILMCSMRSHSIFINT